MVIVAGEPIRYIAMDGAFVVDVAEKCCGIAKDTGRPVAFLINGIVGTAFPGDLPSEVAEDWLMDSDVAGRQ